jgi:hypothetical protein
MKYYIEIRRDKAYDLRFDRYGSDWCRSSQYDGEDLSLAKAKAVKLHRMFTKGKFVYTGVRVVDEDGKVRWSRAWRSPCG